MKLNSRSWYSHIRSSIGDMRIGNYRSHINKRFANTNKLLPPLQAVELPAYSPLCAIVNGNEVHQYLKRIAGSNPVALMTSR